MEYWGFLLFVFFPPPVSSTCFFPHWSSPLSLRLHWASLESPPYYLSATCGFIWLSFSPACIPFDISHMAPSCARSHLCQALRGFSFCWEMRRQTWGDRANGSCCLLVWVCVNPVCRPSCRCYNVMDRGCFVSVSAFWYLYALAKQKGTQSCESTD